MGQALVGNSKVFVSLGPVVQSVVSLAKPLVEDSLCFNVLIKPHAVIFSAEFI